MNKSYVVALSALAIDVCLAGSFNYDWDVSAPQSSFGGGKVALTLDGAAVSAMSVDTAVGDTVTFSGDPMTFSSGASVRVARGVLDFANGITAAGTLSFAGETPAAWIAGDEGLYGDAFTTVLANTVLSDIEVTAAYLNASASGGDANGNSVPYYLTRGDTWMEVQLQQYLSGASTKVVKIRLEQVGADVKAKILYAKYVSSQNALGEDFDNPSGRFTIGTMGVRMTTDTPQYRYGCNKLLFTLVKGVVAAKVSGPFVSSGTVDVGAGVTFGLVNQTTATVSQVSLPAHATFAVTTDGAGLTDDVLHEKGYVTSSNWSSFAPGRDIRDIDTGSISGTLAGSSLSSTPVDAWVGYCRWISATVLSVQFQFKAANSSYTKGVLAKLRQSGDNVEIIAIKGYYYAGDAGSRSFEDTSGGISAVDQYASSTTSAGYCLASVSAAFARQNASRVTLINGGTAKGGTIEISGTSADCHAELRVTSSAGLPTNGVVKVGRYGVFSLINADTSWVKSVSDGTCAIHVGPGGKFRQGGDSSFSFNLHQDRQEVVIDGGEAEFGCECTKESSSSDPVDTSGSTYLNFLTLRNGARCYGKAVRFGNCDGAKWIVEGSSPSVWDASISLLAANGTAQKTVEFSVADVTSSEAVDFTVSGDMKMFNPTAANSYKNLHVKKTGSGTMKVDGETDFTVYPLEVLGGVWMVGSDSTMTSAQNISLDGGAFATADGVAASIGTLTVGEGGGGIVAGANSSIRFLDSSAAAWNGRLDVTCLDGATVRFGTASSALTAAQQRRLYMNGGRAKLNQSGVVVLQGGFFMSIR